MYKRIIPVLIAFLLSFMTNAQVAFDLGEVSGDQGTQVCVPVTVTDFTNIASFGFTILYNPLELNAVSINWLHSPASPGANLMFPGIINIAWLYSFAAALDLNDGDVVFEICFDILGPPGTVSPLVFGDGTIPNTVPPDASDGNFNPLVIAGLTQGSVTITGSSGGLSVIYGRCSTLDVPVSNGSIQIQISGGTPPYTATYTEIANPGNTGNFTIIGSVGTTPTNLPSGAYTITVSDSAGGSETTIQTIQQLTPLLLPMDRTDPSCAGGNNGTITLNSNNPLGGLAPHTIIWSTTAVNTQVITGLVQGAYTVTVTDSDGCVMFGSQAITDPLAVMVDSISQTNLSCNGNDMDGALAVSGSGGTIAMGSDYTYNWTGPGAFTSSSPSIINLPLGQYCVDVMDDNMCLATRCFTIAASDGPIITGFTTVGIGCPGDMNGGITVNFTPGVNPPVDILWSTTESTQTITGLGAGTYTVTLSDATGCRDSLSETIAAPNALTIDSVGIELPPCSYDAQGRLAVIMSGGSGNYTYLWDNMQTGGVNFALECGQSYSVTISDGSTCPTVDTTVFLPCPPDIIADFPTNLVFDVSCDMGIPCDGMATVNASGGTTGSGLYNFIWSSGESTTGMGQSTALALCQGWNYVTINDLDCAFTDSVWVDAPPAITIDELNIDNISCNGAGDGSITVGGAGGVGGFSYQWNGGPAADTYSGLSASTYTVTVTDANLCTSETSILLPEPAPIDLQVSSGYTSDPSCNNSSDGAIELFFTGGNAGTASYNWNPNVSTSSFAANLAAGVYDITVTDSRGCTGETSYTLMSPPPIDFTLGPILEPACFGEQGTVSIVDAMGGTGMIYTYSVGQSIRRPITQSIFISAGDDIPVRVYDENGCFDEQLITVNTPDELILQFGAEGETIDLGETIVLDPFIQTQFPLDSIIWDPITDLACLDSSNLSVSCDAVEVNPFNNTEYEITIIDINGCRTTASYKVTVDKNRGIYFPNVFSPNNDGLNDFFTMFTGPGIEEISSVQVYSRWGELVTSLDAFQPMLGEIPLWDGFFRGKAMNPGVFIYVVTVKFIDGVDVTYRGDITVLR